MKFIVEGMTCSHCVAAITRAVTQLDADARVQVDLAGGVVEADSGLAPAFVAAAIEAEGYVVGGTLADASRDAPGDAPRCCGSCHG